MTGAAVLERTPDSTRGAVGTVTVVVPARNAARDLPRVLKPLRDAGWRIVVVDDHSTDATAEVAASMGATVMLSQGEANDYMARNTGALASDSEFLVFLDADVVAPAAVVRRALETVARGEAACVFGVYDRGDHLDGVVSRYKNFWIRVSTLDAPRPLTWINTSLAVMRRETYRAAGGFETTFTRGRGGGDLDFGRRVAARCGPIETGDAYAVSHLKRFTLGSLLKNDFNRARGWLRLSLYRRGLGGVARRPACANVNSRFSAGVVAAAGILAGLALLPFTVWGLLPVVLYATAQLLLGVPFLRAAHRERIPGRAWFPALLLADQIACAAGLAAEVLARVLGRRHPLRNGLGIRPNPQADPEPLPHPPR